MTSAVDDADASGFDGESGGAAQGQGFYRGFVRNAEKPGGQRSSWLSI